ncbi:hypothetical protein ACS0TY_026460 [Phlomoides rotata]
MAKTAILVSTILALMNCMSMVLPFDSSPLQDFCVADKTSTVHMDGLACKNPATVTVDDFFYSGLHIPANISKKLGVGFKTVSVQQVPGLNTQGLYLGRMDLQPNGHFPPHYHARATEIVTVLEGSVEFGFVTSYPEYKNYKKVLVKGDVFVVPVGLIHYARHVGTEPTVMLWAFNSQNPGVTPVTGGVFAAQPPIDSDYLSQAYLLDEKTVGRLQNQIKV